MLRTVCSSLIMILAISATQARVVKEYKEYVGYENELWENMPSDLDTFQEVFDRFLYVDVDEENVVRWKLERMGWSSPSPNKPADVGYIMFKDTDWKLMPTSYFSKEGFYVWYIRETKGDWRYFGPGYAALCVYYDSDGKLLEADCADWLLIGEHYFDGVESYCDGWHVVEETEED